MPKHVKVNVVGHRMIDNGRVIEDVTSVDLPMFEHPTTSISKVSGMVMDVDFPNRHRLNAASFGVHHNNGVNCRYLSDPGRHEMEFRGVRQDYVVAEGNAKNETFKYRIIGELVSSEHGSVELDSPLGGTNKYSTLRVEIEENGEIIYIADAMAGILRVNGVDISDEIEKLLE